MQAIIKPTLGALFQISERPDGLESILRVNDQTDGALLTDIIQHIKFTSVFLTFLSHRHFVVHVTSLRYITARSVDVAFGNGNKA